MVEFYDEHEEQNKKIEELIKQGKRKRKSWKHNKPKQFIIIKCLTCGSNDIEQGIQQRDNSICLTCLEAKQKGYRKHTEEDYNIMYVIE